MKQIISNMNAQAYYIIAKFIVNEFAKVFRTSGKYLKNTYEFIDNLKTNFSMLQNEFRFTCNFYKQIFGANMGNHLSYFVVKLMPL